MNELFFCTLFDSNYLAKGILTIQSLMQVCPTAKVYILAMDNKTEEVIKSLQWPQVVVISLSSFEDDKLLEIKAGRSKAEYCWTCSSSFCYYCIVTYSLPHCIYIDADLYFYASPMQLFAGIKDKDVMITEHRYTPCYDQSARSGKYCVQFMYFKNTENGMRILKWWKDACIEWCYARFEDGKFGDQKYLDDWQERFGGVYVMENEGGGLAPWNIQQYQIKQENGLQVVNHETGKKFPLVFYHFHHLNNFKLRDSNEFRMGPYAISSDVVSLIYMPYMRQLISLYKLHNKTGCDILGSQVVELSYAHFVFHRIKARLFPKDKYLWRN